MLSTNVIPNYGSKSPSMEEFNELNQKLDSELLRLAGDIAANQDAAEELGIHNAVMQQQLTELDTALSSKVNAEEFNQALEDMANQESPAFTGIPTVNGNMIYHTGNITISNIAPTTALPENHIHHVY